LRAYMLWGLLAQDGRLYHVARLTLQHKPITLATFQ
jgi:hypothetical protein